MKKTLFLLILFSTVICNSFAQKDYASVYFYVPKKITVLPATIHITINGIEAAELKKGNLLEYRINNPQVISIEAQARGMGLMTNPAVLELDVQDIREHYYETKWTVSGIKLEKVKSLPKKINLKDQTILTDDMLANTGNDSISEAADENTSDSTSTSGFGWMASGTGFFINEKGYIATNYHVVEDASAFEVEVSDGEGAETKSFRAVIVSSDKQNDLAILKIDDDRFETMDKLRYNFTTSMKDVGTDVFTLGYPLTNIMGDEIKYTDGVISARTGYQGDVTTYQMTVPIQPGNSGGPLFSSDGELIGITSSGMETSGRQRELCHQNRLFEVTHRLNSR